MVSRGYRRAKDADTLHEPARSMGTYKYLARDIYGRDPFPKPASWADDSSLVEIA
jgi:hypothetical protein